MSDSTSNNVDDLSKVKQSKGELMEPENQYSSVNRVVGIVSGKGGVGKSFVSSYLSVLFQRKGCQTAILDADVTGPSIPKAFGIHRKASASELGITPEESAGGTRVMSVNLLLETEDTPVVWRGPIIAGTVKQFWTDVVWGDVDYMFVDMPPGTGDVPLTVFQSIPLDGIVIVTSPQDLVSMIVKKAVNMANSMNIPVLGIIENYSYFKCPDCNSLHSIFGESRIDAIAAEYGIPVLGRLPIDPAIAQAVDAGKIESLTGEWLDEAADNIQYFLDNMPESEVEEGRTMRVAVTTDENGQVFPQFSKCSRFTVFEMNNSRILGRSLLDAQGSSNEELCTQLSGENIDILICGGIGKGAMELLKQSGIGIVPGAMGEVEKVLISFFTGKLVQSQDTVK